MSGLNESLPLHTDLGAFRHGIGRLRTANPPLPRSPATAQTLKSAKSSRSRDSHRFPSVHWRYAVRTKILGHGNVTGSVMGNGIALSIFVVTLVATFLASWLARRHARAAGTSSDSLDGRRLNRWLIGLSAGTTANSGFIVTAAVGLGYSYGMQWVLLPIAWLLGDLVFWRYFPDRINRYGHATGVTTLSELVGVGLRGPVARFVTLLSAVTILICLAGYTSAQWLAGQKFLAGALGLPKEAALVAFAALIASYTALGGFRGSVYADTFQAVVRIIGTIVALIAIWWFVSADPGAFAANLNGAGPGFLSPLPAGGALGLVGFVVGFAAAAIGFGVGQPQIVSRYLAGRSPEETASAKWIYIGFVQFTWIAMTLFGVVLRGAMPNLSDPETGLSAFFQAHINPIATGIIVADIFATIASTSNSLLVAMAQCLTHDLWPSLRRRAQGLERLTVAVTLILGAVTLALSAVIHGSVVSLALSSVSLLGAGLAPAVMVRVLNWRHSATSIALGMLTGLGSAIAWKAYGWSGWMNEAAIGIALGLVGNYLVVFLQPRSVSAKTV